MILWLRHMFGLDAPKPEPAPRRRGYAGARVGRDLADWITSQTNADAEIRRDIRRLRERSRDLERNSEYTARYLEVLENNVLGASGIGLQSKARNVQGNLDIAANRAIETAWREWSKWIDWPELQRLILRAVARDGDVMILFNRSAKNPYRFSLTVVEGDFIDHEFSRAAGREGPEIRMGVEIDEFGEPLGYWVYDRHPGDEIAGGGMNRRRISARDGLLLFRRLRPGQTRGAPWVSPVMTRLRHLDGYAEAELIAARVGACQGGFLTREEPDENRDLEPSGPLEMELTPGGVQELPTGVKFDPFQPTHPQTGFGEFAKSTLRGISMGLGVAYHTLAGDLESVNYSSARVGLLEEREQWKKIQNWFCARLAQPVFEAWLEMQLLLGATIRYPLSQFDKLNSPEWKPRRWGWVDPDKDISAKLKAIDGGLESRRAAISEAGGDIEDVFEEIAEDQELAESLGLQFSTPQRPEQPPAEEMESEDIEGESGARDINISVDLGDEIRAIRNENSHSHSRNGAG